MSVTCLVQLLGADSRLEAGVKLLFKNLKKSQYEISNSGEIALVDGDSVEGKSILRKSIKPYYIIMSVNPEGYEHPFVIRKPIKSHEIVGILNTVQNILLKERKLNDVTSDTRKEPPTTGNPFEKFSNKEYQKTFAQSLKAKISDDKAEADIEEDHIPLTQTLDFEIDEDVIEIPIIEEIAPHKEIKIESEVAIPSKEMLHHTLFQGIRGIPFEHSRMSEPEKYCGLSPDIDLMDASQQSNVFFDENNYLCGHLVGAYKKALKEGKTAVLELDNDYIFLVPEEEKIYTSLPETSLYVISLMPVDQSLTVNFLDRNNELFKIAKKHSVAYYGNLEVMLAKITLWSSKGRLFNGTSLNQALGKKLRNLSLPQDLIIPDMDKISNFWRSKSVSLIETVEVLSIPQRYIFSYYCLCIVMNAFTADEKKTQKTVKQPENSDHSETNPPVLQKQKKTKASESNDLEALLAELQRL